MVGSQSFRLALWMSAAEIDDIGVIGPAEHGRFPECFKRRLPVGGVVGVGYAIEQEGIDLCRAAEHPATARELANIDDCDSREIEPLAEAVEAGTIPVRNPH